MALLARPGPLLKAIGGRPPDATARRFARILGTRQLVELILLARHPSPTWLRAGLAVDAIHAVTAAALADRDHHRRLAGANTISATGFAAAGLWAAHRQAGRRR